MLQTSFIYNPANQSKEDLINNFVIRKKEFEKIFYDLKNSEMKNPEQHYIIQGQRGYGKTTLLLRLYHEINKDPETNKKYIPIIFKEEQYNIRTLEKLWEYIAECLEESNFFTGIVSEIESKEELENAEEEYFAILERTLKQNDKKIILLIDNIGDILNKFRPKETQRLREVLLTTAEIRIIGASSVVLEHTYDYSKPFFEFFKIVKLNGLNSEETIKLLLKLGENNQENVIQNIIKNEPERIESLRRLTGGVPRTIVLLFEIFTDDKDGSSFKDLEKILDLVTPLYKHRMDDLSPVQQDIAHTIAMAWDAVSTKYISEKVKMESKVVSAQLKELEKNNIVLKINTSKKNHLYQISERFFNIWYLMRYGRKKDQERVKWLVEFLEIWCNKDELGNRVEKHIKALKEGTLYERHALFMTEALARTEIDKEKQHELIECTRNFFKQNNSELLNELSSSDYEIEKEAFIEIGNENFELALILLKKLRNKPMKEILIDLINKILQNDYLEAFRLGFIYEHMKKPEKAEKYYQKFINSIKEYEKFIMAYEITKNFSSNNNYTIPIAEKYYQEILSKISFEELEVIGHSYIELNDLELSQKYNLLAIEKGSKIALFTLGLLYEQNLELSDKSKKYYSLALKNNVRIPIKFLLEVFHCINNLKNKNAIEFLISSYKKHSNFDDLEKILLSLILENRIEKAIDLFSNLITNLTDTKNINFTNILMLFIAKKQYNYTFKLFQDETLNFKNKYKPIYYALMYFMQDKYPDEYLKMGEELKETVEEIINRINQMEIGYK